MTEESDRRLVAGCLLGSFVGTAPPPWLVRAVEDGLGGVLLFAQNVVDDGQVAALCAELRAARADVVIAVDEEGGDVTRLDAATGSDTPSPAAFGVVDDVALTTAAFALLGRRLSGLGIDLTLAPCADINSDPRNPIIGVRSFGTGAELVARQVAAAVDGFRRGGVATCAKHFPGHGDTIADTHRGPARVEASMDTLRERELVPFAAAIEAGAEAVLTAHLVAAALDGSPVSLSAPWTRFLRDEMGFDGVVVTDALDMEAVAEGRGIAGVADAAVRALESGADLLCLGSNFDEAMTATVVDRVMGALAEGRLDRRALAGSVERIRRLRGRDSAGGGDPAAAGLVARRALAIDGRIPAGPFAVLECRPPGSMACFNVSWGIAATLGGRGWPVADATAADDPRAVVEQLLATAGDVALVVVVRDDAVHPWQRAVVEACVGARPTVVVELGWPSACRWGAAATVVTHGAARSSAAAVIDLLGGTS